ncbi:MAG TPA: translation initiation factor [Myxococcales bacterium]|jgi:translation initiation factor 1|nr:translation initiation factor [Myxococcales bacterium]
MSDDKPFNNPFVGLLGRMKDLPHAPEEKPKEREPATGPAKAVVRMERKGRGGKEITAIEQLGLKSKDLETWLKELKNALGCGGAIEEEAIVLQGDQRKRLPALLAARGVRKVIVSG